MKKTKNIIRIILVAAFLFAGIIFIINTIQIFNYKAVIEEIIQKETSYFNDETFFAGDYYKYRDGENIEYWVCRHTDQFDYMLNPNVDKDAEPADQDEAKQIALVEAKRWDKDFFSLNTICELIGEDPYEFCIYQADTAGFKTGKFIIVKISGEDVEYLSMHTAQNDDNLSLGSSISEETAIGLAYSQTVNSEKMLKKEDVHLVKTNHYKESSSWVWEIKLWDITEDEINSLETSIQMNSYFMCIIDAGTQEIIKSGWITEPTDYCPLTGEILDADE